MKCKVFNPQLITNSSKFKLEKEFTDLSDHIILKLECFDFEKIVREKTVIQIRNWNFDVDRAAEYFLDLLESL